MSGQVWPFLVALFAVGCGASILETAANPFMAQFGPAATSERRLNFAQAFNPPGTILGVLDRARNSSFRRGADARLRSRRRRRRGLMRRICTARSCGWCRPTSRWARWCCCLRFVLSRMRFPTITSEHEGERGGHGSFARCCTIRSCGLRWRRMCSTSAGRSACGATLIFYMKQYTPVSEKTAANYIDLFAGRDAGRAIRLHAADEVRLRRASCWGSMALPMCC